MKRYRSRNPGGAPVPFATLMAALLVLALAVAGFRLVLDHGTSPAAGARAPAVSPSSPERSPEKRVRENKKERNKKTGYHPTGHLAVVQGSSPAEGSGPGRRYIVEVERGLPFEPERFAEEVQRVLSDPRSWGGTYKRVDSGPVAFRVTLAGPQTTDRLCAPVPTNGTYSCYNNGRAVLNWRRWKDGAEAYGSDLARYHVYMINHEVGHALGNDHALCSETGKPAPVMMQQSKGVYPCRPNPWPLDTER